MWLDGSFATPRRNFSLSKNSMGSDRGTLSWVRLWCSRSAFKVFFQGQVQSRRILFTCIVADIAKTYQSVLRPELMALLVKCGIPPRFSIIIRGLIPHARYRVKYSEGRSEDWFNMIFGHKEGWLAAPIEFSIFHSFIMKELKSRGVRFGFSSEEFNDLPLTR